MECYIKNPAFEYIDDDQSVVLFDEDMKAIYNIDYIGKTVLDLFEEPVELNLLVERLENSFINIKESEVLEFIEWLKQNQIIIQVQD